jgi:hypothetical protein
MDWTSDIGSSVVPTVAAIDAAKCRIEPPKTFPNGCPLPEILLIFA